MKKLLFSALIAVAAISGATAFPVYNSNVEWVGNCVQAAPDPDCAMGYGDYYDENGQLFTYQELEGLDYEP